MAKRTKKKRSAWGSITQIDKSTYRIRYWAETPTGYQRKSCTVPGSRMDAERKRSELMLEHGDDAPCPTVGKVWTQWALPTYERRIENGDMAKQSLAQFVSAWNRHAGPRWGGVPCDQIRPLDIQQWLDGMTLGPAERSMNVLRPTLDIAVRYGHVSTNPFREKYLMPAKSTKARQDKTVWTLDELGDLWRDRALGMWWESVFLAMAFGGLRVGEALALRSEDVTTIVRGERAVVTLAVARQMPNHGKETNDKLKNPQSARTVCVPGRAGRRLLSISADAASDARGGWLAGDGMGLPNNQVRLNRSWAAAMGAERHPMRNLRNSFETNTRWTLGVPPWILEPIMGHAGKGVTGQYYDRPNAEMLAFAMDDAYLAKPYDAGWIWIENG